LGLDIWDFFAIWDFGVWNFMERSLDVELGCCSSPSRLEFLNVTEKTPCGIDSSCRAVLDGIAFCANIIEESCLWTKPPN
jgi:hypothetical protein